MATYNKPMKCSRCGFNHNILCSVYGDFDGWDDWDLILEPKHCPFCKHLKTVDIDSLLPPDVVLVFTDPRHEQIAETVYNVNRKTDKDTVSTDTVKQIWNTMIYARPITELKEYIKNEIGLDS